MQVNYKEWYLLEIYSRIVRPIGADKAADAILELREHLDESIDEFVSRGLDPELARRAAMDKLGSPAKIAQGFVCSASHSERLKWSITVAVALSVAFAVMGTDNTLLMGLPYLIPIFVILSSVRTRLPLLPGILAAGAVASFVFAMAIQIQQVYVFDNARMPYSVAHKNCLSLMKQHTEHLKIEGEVAAKWRDSMRGPLGTGSYSLPAIVYRQSSEGYQTRFDGRGYVIDENQFEAMGYFSLSPLVTSKSVKSSDLKRFVQDQLGAVAQRQIVRKKRMKPYLAAVNVSRLERAKALWPSWLFISIAGTFATWAASWLLARLCALVLTRRKQLLA